MLRINGLISHQCVKRPNVNGFDFCNNIAVNACCFFHDRTTTGSPIVIKVIQVPLGWRAGVRLVILEAQQTIRPGRRQVGKII